MQTADQGYLNADLDVVFSLRADQKQDFFSQSLHSLSLNIILVSMNIDLAILNITLISLNITQVLV